jgi:hypothetical protein
VGAHVLLQRGGELRPLGVLHRHEVLDAHRVQHLAAEALRGDAGADALARGIDRGRGTGGPPPTISTSNGALSLSFAAARAGASGVELREDLRELHAALAERLAVEEDAGHRHHLAGIDFLLEQRAVDRDVADARVHHAHQVQRLHDVRAVLAGEREIGLEGEVAVERPHLVEQFLLDLRAGSRRPAAAPAPAT